MNRKRVLLISLLTLFIGAVSISLFKIRYFTGNTHKPSGAYQALNFWSQQRAYPNNSIPDAGFYRAFEYAKQNLRRLGIRNSGSDSWRAIGPNNLGGRTLALAFNPQNPNTIYAGSASGGLWRSKSGGRGPAAWEYIPTGYPVLAVSSIAFAPGDSNTIYIGTGEVYNYQAAGSGAAYRSTRGTYGLGILKSVDGGTSWSKSLDWSYNQRRGVWVVKINPLNPNTVWAGTTEGTYKSKDGGQSWTQVHNVIMVNDLVINPVDTNTVIVGCGNFASTGYGIYRTTDGGANWTKSTSGLPTTFHGKIQLDISPSNPDIVYASIGNGFTSSSGASWLCRSTDGGITWSVRSTVDYSKWQGWYSHDVAVNPVNPNEVVAIGIEIYKSTNGGSSLLMKSSNTAYSGRIPPEGPEGPPTYSHVDHHDVIYHPTDNNIIYFANDGGVFRTIDGCQTFESCNGGYQSSQFYNGFSSAETDSLLSIGGFQDNSTAIYDGQPAWFVRLIGGDGAWTAIDPLNPAVMYGSWQYLSIVRTNDGGNNWFNIPPPGSGRLTSFIAPFVLAHDLPQVLYGGRDIIYKSVNGGVTWFPTNGGAVLDGNPALAMAVSPQNSNVVYVATAPYQFNRSHVFRTTDGGINWTNITGSLPDRFPGDIAVNPTNEANVYITFSGYGSPHVFKSSDYGSTWIDISQSLPDIPTNAIVIAPQFPNHIYIGTDIGVHVSVDSGNSWYDFSDGLPDALIVMDLSISPLNRKLRIASHGNGAYERSLLGAVTQIAETGIISTGFELKQNYPNPFNPSTRIEYTLHHAAWAELSVFNVRGQKIKTLISARQSAGTKTVTWDGTDFRGQPVAAGTYFYRLKAGSLVQAKKMSLIR